MAEVAAVLPYYAASAIGRVPTSALRHHFEPVSEQLILARKLGALLLEKLLALGATSQDRLDAAALGRGAALPHVAGNVRRARRSLWRSIEKAASTVISPLAAPQAEQARGEGPAPRGAAQGDGESCAKKVFLR